MDKLIIKPNELYALRGIEDVGFIKTRSFGEHNLACGEQKIDLSKVKNKKVKTLFVEFLKSCSSIRKRTLLRYMDRDYVELRILHGMGYSWSKDVENEFLTWLISTYKVNPKSKTYVNIKNSSNCLRF